MKAPIKYASTPKKPEMDCIQVYPLVLASPGGVTSAITERVGLKLILMARSNDSATVIATPIKDPIPSESLITSMDPDASPRECETVARADTEATPGRDDQEILHELKDHGVMVVERDVGRLGIAGVALRSQTRRHAGERALLEGAW